MIKNGIIRKIIFSAIVIYFVAVNLSYASNTEGTSTYKDYLFILVHGINGGSNHFNGQDHRDKDMKLLQYLENNLGLEGRVYAYSFNDKNASSLDSVREFGDRTYSNPASYVDKNGSTYSMNGKCWIEKAKEDFINSFKKIKGRDPSPDEVPSKYIIITHSMGNMPARLYIYSKQVLGKDLYKDDIAKVVFVAPPLTGSDLAYFALIPKTLMNYVIVRQKAEAWFNIAQRILGGANSFLIDPYAPYKIAKEVSFLAIDAPMFFDYLEGLVGTGGRRVDPIEGGGYGLLDAGTYELIPEIWHSEFGELLTAKFDDPAKEPVYSVVYGQGGPVLDITDAVKNKLASMFAKYVAIKFTGFEGIEKYIQDFSLVNSDCIAYSDSLFGKVTEFFGELGPEIETMMPGSGFYNLPTEQAKFISLVLSNPLFSFTEDGDCAVPVHSAKGIFQDKIGNLGRGSTSTYHLRNASFHSKVFKGEFNDFLEVNMPNYIAGAVTAYGVMRLVGTPHEIALPICQWSLVMVLVGEVLIEKDDIQKNFYIHTNVMLKEYDLIRTSILDTPALFTVNDIQTTFEVTSSTEASSEVTALSITAPSSPPTGLYSMKIKSVQENRNYHGNQEMAFPITLEGNRRYIEAMTVTKPPKRVCGKLNYLIPRMMKQFQYSFNFAAWKDITGVNNETGEFVLDDLPFAEGQNILAIRATNAVDIKSHQICKFVLNTIPMLIQNMLPAPSTYIRNNLPEISGEFSKSVYVTNTTPGQGIPDISSAWSYKNGQPYLEILKDPNFKVQYVKENDYKTLVKFSWKPSTALEDGEYQIVVTAKSEVGSSQGAWTFWVDTHAPTIMFTMQ